MSRREHVRACEAAREALRRARHVKLTESGRKVLEAVISLTALYSKTSDDTYAAVIAAEAGVHVKTALHWLAVMDDKHVIGWTPRQGRSRRSTISLRPRVKGSGSPSLSPPVKGSQKGSDSDSLTVEEPKTYTESRDQDGSLLNEKNEITRIRDEHERGLR
jgi:drug/metabolite transporter superfamily protein YnfA